MKKLTQTERRNILDMIEGCITRILIAENSEEIVSRIGYINRYLNKLADNRLMELREEYGSRKNIRE